MSRPSSVALLLLSVLGACAEDAGPPPPPATYDDVVAACAELDEAVCHAIGECEGWSGDRIRTCIDAGSSCRPEKRTWCWTAEKSALERCAEEWSEKACDDIDDLALCIWSCPVNPPPEE